MLNRCSFILERDDSDLIWKKILYVSSFFAHKIVPSFFQGQDLVIGNVGDSRAVLGMRDKDDSLVAIQLTVDLKPNLPGLRSIL